MNNPINNYSDLDVFVLTYNRECYLKIMLESLCIQTARGFTIKVLDNASTDGTAQMIQGVQAKYPERQIVHICHEKNIGNPANFKKTQELTEGKYTAVFHDDDVVHPEYIEAAMKLLYHHSDAVMASCFYQPIINPSNYNWMPFRGSYYLWGKKNMPVLSLLMERLCFAAMIYRTDAYKQVEYHPEKYGKIFDNPFLLEMGIKGDSLFLTDIGLRYRLHPGSDSNNIKTGPFVHELIAALLKTKELLKAKHYLKQILLYNFANLLFGWAQIKEVSWNEFVGECIKSDVFTDNFIKLYKIRLIRKFVFKRSLKMTKKYFSRKTLMKR